MDLENHYSYLSQKVKTENYSWNGFSNVNSIEPNFEMLRSPGKEKSIMFGLNIRCNFEKWLLWLQSLNLSAAEILIGWYNYSNQSLIGFQEVMWNERGRGDTYITKFLYQWLQQASNPLEGFYAQRYCFIAQG